MARIERGKLIGYQDVTDHLELYGQATADVRVHAVGILDLYGQVMGELVIKEGGAARVYGQVCRDIRNEGGNVEISGMVLGSVIRIAGTTKILPGASIDSER